MPGALLAQHARRHAALVADDDPAGTEPATDASASAGKTPTAATTAAVADDTTVPIGQSRIFYEALRAKGVPTEFVIEPGVGHSWLGKSPAATRAASYDAMKRTVDFIEATIGDHRPASR